MTTPLPVRQPLSQDEMRQLLRECALVVKPGETLIVRVPTTWTPDQAMNYQEYATSVATQQAPGLSVVVLAADELAIADPEAQP